MKVVKPEISYVEFRKFKDEYLRDIDPLRRFGELFCEVFGVSNDRIHRTETVTDAYVAINAEVEWVI